jgi:hypothetical protein
MPIDIRLRWRCWNCDARTATPSVVSLRDQETTPLPTRVRPVSLPCHGPRKPTTASSLSACVRAAAPGRWLSRCTYCGQRWTRLSAPTRTRTLTRWTSWARSGVGPRANCGAAAQRRQSLAASKDPTAEPQSRIIKGGHIQRWPQAKHIDQRQPIRPRDNVIGSPGALDVVGGPSNDSRMAADSNTSARAHRTQRIDEPGRRGAYWSNMWGG